MAVLDLGLRGVDSWSAEDWSPYVTKDRGRTWGVRDEDGLKAFAAFSTVLDEAELLFVGVASEVQGKGWGRKLLAHAIEALEQQGVQTIFLEVSEENIAARHLYEALGFQRVGKRVGYYRDGSTAFQLVRRVDPSSR